MQLDCYVRFQIHLALAGSFPKGILKPPINHETDKIVFGCCCDFVYHSHYSILLPASNPRRHDVVQTRNNLTFSLLCTGLIERFNRRALRDDMDVMKTDPVVNYIYRYLSGPHYYRIGYKTEWNIYKIFQDYTAWNIEILMRNTNFRELLDRVPSLEKAIFRSMWEYVWTL
ncbi:hypothetical protein BDV38DRAFT_272155 [Aspergillus pseudotamarii]|uniref:Uncharacterized protein n=1 Tax=Aspergillus pseudotamarii TaxID=132259 RepID=A0A5N6SNR9_ASPPS|nr:uncharacterized protein BDV38DRAFT_272155 [Aspergillus pseudotamarii]KAE8136332.1 hypothetical protein BDV38DRAFT_272155 [Aspergillus pseudotamarii]